MEGGSSPDAARNLISVPNDMAAELAVLNDLSQSDTQMMFHVRQFVATFAKKLKDLGKDAKEAKLKADAASRKAETQDGKISSTR